MWKCCERVRQRCALLCLSLRVCRHQQAHRVPEPGEKTRLPAYEGTNASERQPWCLPRDRRPCSERRGGNCFEGREGRRADACFDGVEGPHLPPLEGRGTEPAVAPCMFGERASIPCSRRICMRVWRFPRASPQAEHPRPCDVPCATLAGCVSDSGNHEGSPTSRYLWSV